MQPAADHSDAFDWPPAAAPGPVEDRLAPLIEERAPWLFSGRRGTATARAVLDRLLGQKRTVEIATALDPHAGPRVMDTAARLVCRRLDVTGLGNIPATGPALIVANHPTGIADGLTLWRALATRRPDLFFYANADILRVLPQLSQVIAPVEWREEKRCHAKARATMAYTRQALVEDGRLGVIFPSGRLAKRRGLRLHERPWMASAAQIARRFDVPVIPIHIRARNSALFYAFDAIHPTLRDITLFHEVLNKARQPFRVTIGAPIPAADLPRAPEAAIAHLRRATLALGEDQGGGGLSLLKAGPPRLLPSPRLGLG
ncbi:lysophospholipid acyltransferase family protein [Maritalea mobilis]|uniref:lysophospholipid acyltransferase family protein n=1 Tax=Maritalea mobilis TaxID=483324 RepID=UPI001C96FA44|nr:lysophospholipid acyltransferase family protein [Maritalea mobilis]MBY6200713.1 lysophospholipid acyltransferase family protein [Maritalea mobilis]